jgi:hypothetical protein
VNVYLVDDCSKSVGSLEMFGRFFPLDRLKTLDSAEVDKLTDEDIKTTSSS